MTFLRRLRGAGVIALFWGVAWLPVGIVLGVIMGWVRFPDPRARALSFLAFWTGIAVVSGAVFSALLAWLERHHTVDKLSARRVVVWGALGGATVPVLSSLTVLALTDGHLTAAVPPVLLAMAALGAACARATLWLARRKDRPQAPIVPHA